MRRLLAIIIAAMMLIPNTASYYQASEEAARVSVETSGELVIVLDPGHDDTHAGAGGNGLREEDIVLKIALYLRDELNKYKNVKVYLTREAESCPFPETCGINEGSKRCNEARVAFAQSVDADIYIALHLNSYSSSSANGALVFVPNNNYVPDIGTIGQNLGKSIVGKLGELGLAVDGEGIRAVGSQADTKPEEYYYPDGSVADYYRVIRYAKKALIPAIIVEHAFISNASDATNFLSSDEKLMALAIKDAEGIAAYYGMTLQDGYVAGTAPEINFVPVPTPEPTPMPEPTPEPSTETESESETEIETELETESETQTEQIIETQGTTDTEEEISTETVEDTIIKQPEKENDFLVWLIIGVLSIVLVIVFGIWWYRKKR